MIDKPPPYALDIEEALLGALIIEGDQYDYIKDIVHENMFYSQDNAIIFESIKQLYFNHRNIDLLTVAEKVKGRITALKLTELTSRVGSALHVKEHAIIIYEKWVSRESIRLGNKLSEHAYNSDDILDTITGIRNDLDDRIMNMLGLNSIGINISESSNRSIEDYYKREQMRKENKFTGIPTSFKPLNKKTGGLQKEQLIILAGRPAMGKTSVAINFLINAASYEYKCAFFSLEMTAARLTDKIICSIAEIDFSAYKKGELMDSQREDAERSLDVINKWNITFNDSMLINIEQVHANCKAIKNRFGLDIVFIDYLQLMRTSEKTGNREQEISTISRNAKKMAVDLQVPVVLLSQLNRAVESRADKRPMLSDLRESGSIEQDADIVLFLYRDSVYNDTAKYDTGEVIVAKHREGEIGTFEFKHNSSLTKFWDVDNNIPDIDVYTKDAPF